MPNKGRDAVAREKRHRRDVSMRGTDEKMLVDIRESKRRQRTRSDIAVNPVVVGDS